MLPILLLLALLVLPGQADALAKYYGVAQDTYGNAMVSASITIYRTGTQTKPTIYSDDGVTAKANPFTTSADGTYSFYVAPGRYDFVTSKTGYDFTTQNAAMTDLPIGGATTASITGSPWALTTGAVIIGTPANGSDYSFAWQGWNTGVTNQYYRLGRAPNFAGSAIGGRRDTDTTLAATRIEFWEASASRYATNLIGVGNDSPQVSINCDAAYTNAFGQTGSTLCRVGINQLSPTNAFGAALDVNGDVKFSATHTSTSGTVYANQQTVTYQDGGTNSTTVARGLDLAYTLNYTGASRTGSFEGIKLVLTSTSSPTGGVNLMNLQNGANTFIVDSSTNLALSGFVNAVTGFKTNGTAGVSATKTVRAAGGAGDCTLIFSGGILIAGGTC